jgi:AcrR family transcriptional regulator
MPRMTKYDRQVALERAMTLFWARGYTAASMKLIEHALDMRPGSLYAAFGSKDGLFAEALELYLRNMFAELDDHLAGFSSIIEGLEDFVLKVGASPAEAEQPPANACMLVKTLLELNDAQTPVQSQINDIFARIEARFTAIIEEARSRGETRRDLDCDRMARLFQAQMMGLRSFAQREVPPEHVQALAEDVVDLLRSKWRRGG